MEEMHGSYTTTVIISADTSFYGLAQKDVVVKRGRLLHLYGMIDGDLHLEPGSTAIVYGMVNGSVRNSGGKIEIHGVVRR